MLSEESYFTPLPSLERGIECWSSSVSGLLHCDDETGVRWLTFNEKNTEVCSFFWHVVSLKIDLEGKYATNILKRIQFPFMLNSNRAFLLPLPFCCCCCCCWKRNRNVTQKYRSCCYCCCCWCCCCCCCCRSSSCSSCCWWYCCCCFLCCCCCCWS